MNVDLHFSNIWLEKVTLIFVFALDTENLST